MTLDEFLDDYVPRVLKPMGGWSVDDNGLIRRGEWCPLTAAIGYHASMEAGHFAGARLGLKERDRRIVMGGADWKPDVSMWPNATAARARLLAGLGLSETSR